MNGGMDSEQELLDNLNTTFGYLDTQNQIWLETLVISSVSPDLIKVKDEEGDQNEEENVKFLEKQEEKVPQSKRQKQLKHDSRRKMDFRQIPLAVLYTIYQGIKKMNNMVKTDEEIGKGKHKRIRYPRYFDYTKKLEPYSHTKAFVTEIMSELGTGITSHEIAARSIALVKSRLDINMPTIENLFKMYSLWGSEVILTESRIICIFQGEERGKLDSWSLLYSDILNVKLTVEETEYNEIEDKQRKNEGIKFRKLGKESTLKMFRSDDYDFEEDKKDEKQKFIKYYLTIVHFSDTCASLPKFYGTGVVDLLLLKKVIEAKEKDEEIIHEILEEIELRIR